MENNIKVESKKQKPGINWSLIVAFFLLGFIITMPSLIMRLLPVTGTRMMKYGYDILILKDENNIVLLREERDDIRLVQHISNNSEGPDNDNYEPQMLFSGNRIYVLKKDSIDVYSSNKKKKFSFLKNIELK